MRQEHVILLNEQGQPCGTLEKYAAHTATTPLHSAFSCWIFNEQGQLLVTAGRCIKKPGRVSGQTRCAVIHNQGKQLKTPLSVAPASSWELTFAHSRPYTLIFAIVPQIPVELWKMKFVRYTPHS